MSIKTMSAPRRSPRLAALRTLETEVRRSPRLANSAKAVETELRRSPRLAKLRNSIAEAKAAARADQAERAEMTLRRSVRINRPSDEPLRWQAFLVDIEQENTVITPDDETLYTASDTMDSDYEETISDLSDTDYGETDTETDE